MFNKEVILRDGLPIEKGVVLTKDYLDKNASLLQEYLNHWLLYPDIYLDTIQSSEDKYFHLMFYQRIALRACMRYRYHSWTATRATSKSFIAYLSAYLRCAFLPNTKQIVVSDVKGTVIQTAKQKFAEIWVHWPLLKNELKERGKDGEQGEKKGGDYYELHFKNGSTLFVISKDTSRGLRATAAVIEEAALVEEIPYNEVILPQMNVARREVDGYLNPEEPNPHQDFITTAGSKTCFMYGKIIEVAVMSILRPQEYFIWGLDYRVPVHYGLLSKKQLDEQRYSNTMSEDSFARESMSIWTGNSSEAWFDSKKLERRRTLLKCERHAQENPPNPNTFYIVSIDVARYDVNSAIAVFKVLPQKDSFKKHLVYLEVIHGANFITDQAPRIKKIIQLYKPREVVIDGNGMGAGLLDAMVIPSFDKETGEEFPAYYVFNNEDHLPAGMKNPKEEPAPELNAILYDLKANSTNNGLIHANIFAQISNGSVSFLASERIVKDKLLATKKGQKMSNYDRRKYLLPYEMTSRLVDEMNNLKLKPTGLQNQINIEQISRSTPKDRFSAVEYGLWRIKYYEDKAFRRNKRKLGEGSFAFFSPKKRR